MEKLKHVIQKAISEKMFSGIGIEVNHKGNNVLSLYDGKTFFEESGEEEGPGIVTPSHLFDLSSLTKALCTSLVTSILVNKGTLSFDTKICDIFDEYALSYNKDLKDITVAHLLNHSSGLDSWYEIYNVVKNRSDAYMFVRSRPRSYITGSQHLYSDPGYIMLGEVSEIVLEHKLDYIFDHFVTAPLELHDLCYSPTVNSTVKNDKKFVSSGFSSVRNKKLIGEVNDENAYVFKGIAGHAGLFGTATDVCKLGQHLLDIMEDKANYPIIEKQTLSTLFSKPTDGSDWAYGWHYPSKENSTAGKLISKNSVGMTGFTGTSIWIDFDNSLVITILANRTVAPDSAKFGGDKDRFSALRPLLHDIIIGEIK